MPSENVHCIRNLDASPDVIWAGLKDFDLQWHPAVTECKLLRDETGALLRVFSDVDGGNYVEQRTYISNSDRVMCYTCLSGIEGLTSYHARVEVTPDDKNGSIITWHADISAREDVCVGIVAGTQDILEAGLTGLAKYTPKRPTPNDLTKTVSPVYAGTISGNPTLSYLADEDTSGDTSTLILFLHGIGGNAENWRPQLAEFGANYRVAAWNMRGYGDSTLGFSQTQMEDYCDDILNFAKTFNCEKLVLVGLSMGSWIATSFAMRHSDKLSGLVLAGGCTGMSEAPPRERENFRVSREVPLSQGQKPADFAQAVVDVIMAPDATQEARDLMIQSMTAISVGAYRDALVCFCNPLETFDFTKITGPVMMVTGEFDPLAAPEEIQRVSERIFDAGKNSRGISDVRYEVIPGAGHVCNLERPEYFNDLLNRFLHRLPNTARNYKPSRAEKQRIKRNRIIQAAHIEFCETGFDGTSMDNLAKCAAVSKPTLYQYFSDKEGLFEAVLEEARNSIIAPLTYNEGSLVDKLWQFSWTYADFVLRPDMLSLARLVLGEAGRRPESAITYHQAGPGMAFVGLTDFVKDCITAGELQAEDAELAASDLWSLILSGPRDHHLHYVRETPDQSRLLHSIGHGLSVFLKVYSTDERMDQVALKTKIASKASELN